jgi:hypothetical protein
MRISNMNVLLAGSAAASIAGVAMAGVPAVYALQTFSGTGSASVTSDRTNQAGGDANFSLGYNAIAGGASTMSVAVVTETNGSSNSSGKYTTDANKGTFSSGYTTGSGSNLRYVKDYYGTNSGGTSSYNPTVNYRAWDASSSSLASVSGTTLGFSSGASLDTGIADYTTYRYTSNTYSTLWGTPATGSPQTIQKADASGTIGFSIAAGLEYVAATGQSMNLSAATGLTDIRLEGSGSAWAQSGQVEFSLTDIYGVSSVKVFEVVNGEAMGNFTASMSDLSVNSFDSTLLDLTQIVKINIGFWSSHTTSGRNQTLDNTGFTYNASQVSLVGYVVPAPGAVALLGAAGLIGARRRRR